MSDIKHLIERIQARILERSRSGEHPEILQEEPVDYEAILRRAGVPELFLSSSPTDFDFFLPELTKRPEGVLIRGDNGLGKTRLAVALMRQKAERNFSCVFVRFPDLMMRLRDCFKGRGLTESEIVEKVTRPGVAVLDDLGVQKASEYAIEVLYNIIDTRLSGRRMTIITTNLKHSELIARYGKPIASRISALKSYTMSGTDRRKHVRAAESGHNPGDSGWGTSFDGTHKGHGRLPGPA